MGSREIEIKGRLDNAASRTFRQWIETNATYIGKETHREVYLDRPIDSFFEMSEDGEKNATNFLRIRESKLASICLKKWQIDSSGDLTYCLEYKLDVSSFSGALELFESLGYETAVEIYKARSIYRVAEFEIVFDDVNNLGNFFEVEWIGPSEIDPEIVLGRIRRFLVGAGVLSYVRLTRGYVSMLLNPSINYGILENLT